MSKKTIHFYWGDNGEHEFWSDEFVGIIIIRGDESWATINGKIYGDLPKVIDIIEGELGAKIYLNNTKIWSEPRDQFGNLTLNTRSKD